MCRPPAVARWCPRVFYGWVVWAVVVGGQTLFFLGASSGVTFIIDAVRDELGMSQSSIAAAYMVGTLGSALAQVPIGRLVDRFGGRVGMTLTSGLFALSVAALSLPVNWPTLALAFCSLRAFGVGGFALACTTCLQQWFCRRRGLATGLAESIASLLSYSILSNAMVALESALGWRHAYALAGLIVLGVYTPLAALLVRARPEDVGLRPDGDTDADANADVHVGGERAVAQARKHGDKGSLEEIKPALDKDDAEFAENARGDRGCDDSAAGGAPGAHAVTIGEVSSGDWTRSEAVRTRAFVLLCMSNTLAWGFGAGVFFNLVSITREAGLDPVNLAPCVYVPWAFTRAVSMMISGYLTDRFEPRNLLCIGALGVGVGFLLLAPPEGVELTPARGATFGIVHGGMNGLCNAVFRTAPARFFGRKHLGAIMGTMSMWNMAATAFGPLVIGASFDIFGSYRGCLTVVGAVNAGFSLVARFMTMPVRASERPDLTRHQSVQTPRGPVGALARMLVASGPSAVVDAMTPPARESARQTSQWLRVD